MKTAILVVDMLNDFVTGALKCDRGLAIVPKTAKLLAGARKAGVPVIFCNDAHIKGVDHELKLWGDHAIAGTKGAEVIEEMALCDSDYVVPKRRYSGFFHTDLDTADAYCLGYNIVVAKDATDSFTKEDYDYGIKYLQDVYGAEITDVDSLLAKWNACGFAPKFCGAFCTNKFYIQKSVLPFGKTLFCTQKLQPFARKLHIRCAHYCF